MTPPETNGTQHLMGDQLAAIAHFLDELELKTPVKHLQRETDGNKALLDTINSLIAVVRVACIRANCPGPTVTNRSDALAMTPPGRVHSRRPSTDNRPDERLQWVRPRPRNELVRLRRPRARPNRDELGRRARAPTTSRHAPHAPPRHAPHGPNRRRALPATPATAARLGIRGRRARARLSRRLGARHIGRHGAARRRR